MLSSHAGWKPAIQQSRGLRYFASCGAVVHGWSLRTVSVRENGIGGETPPKLAGEDACATYKCMLGKMV